MKLRAYILKVWCRIFPSTKGDYLGKTTGEIAQKASEYADAPLQKSGVNDPASHFAKASLGLTELQRRTAKTIGILSLVFSAFALLFSASAIYFSIKANHLDDEWKEKQLEILQEIKADLEDRSK